MSRRNELVRRILPNMRNSTDAELENFAQMQENSMRVNTVPRRSLHELIQYFEANPISNYTPPPVPPPRRRRVVQLMKFQKAFKGFDRSYKVSLASSKDPLVQMHKSRQAMSEKAWRNIK